jgi:predicted phage tail protein
VRARNSENGAVGPWSKGQSFEIVNLLSPVIQPLPDSTTDTRPSISWTAIEGAVRYEIWANNLSTGQGQVLFDTNVTETSYTAPAHLAVGTYRVWVRAVNAQGLASKWSVAQDFAITAPAAPQLTAPAAEISAAMVTFMWNATTGAETYELWVSNLTTGQSPVLNETGLTDTTFATNLPVGQYRAWVRAINAAGDAGAWSVAHNFRRVHLLKPVLNFPIGLLNFNNPIYNVKTEVHAVRVEIWVDNLTTGQSQVVHETEVTNTFLLDGQRFFHFETETPLANGLYRWWARAFDADGNASTWSEAGEFTVLA